jgi:TolB-like protein/DNA-binding winged helix-turn-helix (wHTH) protein/Flp pilus assembly protein TadD
MAPKAPPDILFFEGFRLEPSGLFELDQAGDKLLALGSRAFDLLCLLTQRQGEILSKDVLLQTVWAGMAIEEGNLTVQIAALRRVIDRHRLQGSCIQTLPGRGYRFVATVTKPEIKEADAVTALPKAEALAALPAGPRYPRHIVAAVAVACLVIIAGGSWWMWLSPKAPSPTLSALPQEKVAPAPQSTARPHLSIVVLPFTNISDDKNQQYFADGITEDLTTDLSRIRDSLVISRNTAFTYKDKPVSAKQIGQELGVRYVLEGSVQRSGNQVRVNAQLIDAETAAHVWAERFERDIGDLFALQNDITSRIAIALNLALLGAEGARTTGNPDAQDYILRGRAAQSKPPTRDNYTETIGLFERALALDPRSVEAQSDLAITLANRMLDLMTDTAAADKARAEALVEQALATSPSSPIAHFAKGQLLRAQNRYPEAIPEFETALASNRNWVSAIANLGQCKFYAGFLSEMIPAQEQAIRLSPRDPYIGNFYARIGLAHLLQSQTEEAILWLEKARSANPALRYVRVYLASAYALKGDSERATAELAEARRLQPEGFYPSIARIRSKLLPGVSTPTVRNLWENTFLAGLRNIGVPEE